MLTLGNSLDAAPLTLDPKALTTHGFILGMTGSGKTGLCVVLVEELLRAGVPVLAVDSKGDLANLLLARDAGDPKLPLAQLGLTPESYAAFRASDQPRLYTPGATLELRRVTASMKQAAPPPPVVAAASSTGQLDPELGPCTSSIRDRGCPTCSSSSASAIGSAPRSARRPCMSSPSRSTARTPPPRRSRVRRCP